MIIKIIIKKLPLKDKYTKEELLIEDFLNRKAKKILDILCSS